MAVIYIYTDVVTVGLPLIFSGCTFLFFCGGAPPYGDDVPHKVTEIC